MKGNLYKRKKRNMIERFKILFIQIDFNNKLEIYRYSMNGKTYGEQGQYALR